MTPLPLQTDLRERSAAPRSVPENPTCRKIIPHSLPFVKRKNHPSGGFFRLCGLRARHIVRLVTPRSDLPPRGRCQGNRGGRSYPRWNTPSPTDFVGGPPPSKREVKGPLAGKKTVLAQSLRLAFARHRAACGFPFTQGRLVSYSEKNCKKAKTV